MFLTKLFHFRVYGLIISVAVLVTLILTYLETKRKKMDPKICIDLAFWNIIGAIIGARLYHVIHRWSYYKNVPWMIPNIWAGGLGLYGGFLGGLAAVAIYCRKRKQDIWKWADVAAVWFPLGQSIGRWANYATQELYGKPTDLPWGIYIIPKRRISGYENFSHFHPLFLYESIWNFFVFLILLYISRKYSKKLLKGELFSLYLSLYSLGRFFNEFLKPDVWKIAGIPMAQLVGVIIIAFSIILALKRRRLAKRVHKVK